MTRVSVIIPNFNHARFLAQRIDSVLGQSLQDFELILLDDASTDGSRAVIERYRGNPRIQVHYNQTNSGSPFAQWNKGLELARGDYVWIAESDDYAYPTFLEELTRRLAMNPRLGVAMCQSYLVDEAGHEALPDWYRTDSGGMWHSDFEMAGPEFCARAAATGNPIPNASAVVFNRSVAAAAGPADETFRLCADWKFWVSLLKQSDFCFVAQPLNCFRMHAASVRSTSERAGLAAEEHYRMANYVARHFPVSPAQRRVARWVMAHHWGVAMWRHRHRIPWSRQQLILREAWALDPWIGARLVKVWWHLRQQTARQLRNKKVCTV